MVSSDWRMASSLAASIRYYSLLASRRHPPDRAVAVLGEQQRAVFRLRHPDRPAPDRGVVDYEAGDEVFVLAGRHAILHDRTDDLVAGTRRPVPGAVRGGEHTALEIGRE